ncbi:MAG: family 20 glycosylhydrolase, partial [Verrucomicrobiota bacterium]
NQNSFGHMERWLKHKQYKALAESPDGFEHPITGWRDSGSTLYPSPESAAFIDALYGELLSNFSSRFFHIGGDEPWELGKGRSLAAVQAKGKHRVYLDFLKQLFGITQKYECYPQFWADVILERPDLVPELPKGACPIIWGYEADSPFEENCRIVSKAGFKDNFYVAPGAGNWNSFSGRLDVARANIALAAKAGSAHRASGFLMTAWGDNGHLQPWSTLYPALILGALATWGISETNAPLAASIDSIFYQDQPPGNGNALCLLGQIDGMLPQPAPPNSFLHTAFLAEETKLKILIDPIETDRFEAVEAALADLQPITLDPEIEHAIKLSQFALEKCKRAKHTKILDTTKAPDVNSLKDEFAKLWLQKSRPGGLEDSLNLIDKGNN